MATPHKVTEADYTNATECSLGYCPTCKDFTRECTEPDAEGYDCETCEGSEVYGAEQALLCGVITVD